MRVALVSYAYAPSIGGVESVGGLLAAGLRARGHSVTVVTASEGEADDEEHVVRRPRAGELIAALRRAEVVLQQNPSLNLAWPLLTGVVRRPVVMVLHGTVSRPDGTAGWKERVKRRTLPRDHLYAVSRFIAQEIPGACGFLPNPFDDEVFHPGLRPRRPVTDLLFVGRLAGVKGVDVLIRAVAMLSSRDDRPWRLRIVGEGPERPSLEALTAQLGMTGAVDFVGSLHGVRLAEAFETHPLVVVPSRREPSEAFGLVAVEAIASGAVPVASRQGGLPEAIGPCGVLVEPEDPRALAETLSALADRPERLDAYRARAGRHLEPFRPTSVITAYEQALRRATGRTRGGAG